MNYSGAMNDEGVSNRGYKQFNYDPLTKATEALAKFENAQKRGEKTIDEIDKEIANAQRELDKDIKSISRWHQARREQLLQELGKIDDHHKSMVADYSAKCGERINELYAEREKKERRIRSLNPPMRNTEDYDTQFEDERFEMGDLFGGVPVESNQKEDGQESEREEGEDNQDQIISIVINDEYDSYAMTICD